MRNVTTVYHNDTEDIRVIAYTEGESNKNKIYHKLPPKITNNQENLKIIHV